MTTRNKTIHGGMACSILQKKNNIWLVSKRNMPNSVRLSNCLLHNIPPFPLISSSGKIASLTKYSWNGLSWGGAFPELLPGRVSQCLARHRTMGLSGIAYQGTDATAFPRGSPTLGYADKGKRTLWSVRSLTAQLTWSYPIFFSKMFSFQQSDLFCPFMASSLSPTFGRYIFPFVDDSKNNPLPNLLLE